MEEKERVLGNMVRAIEKLQASSSFARLIPEVRTNLVYALPDATSPEHVAAVAGRITVVDGLPKAAGPPRFGASSHMARFIIGIRENEPEKRAGINFAYNPELGEWLAQYCKEHQLTVGRIDRSKEPEDRKKREGESMPWKVKEALRSTGGRIPNMAYETGAVGKEPVSVLLGRSAVEVVDDVIRLSDAYAQDRKD